MERPQNNFSPWWLCGAAVLLLLSLSCREKLPTTPVQQLQPVALRFGIGDSFTYDNWLIDFRGKIPESRFTNTWTVVDTGRVLLGRSRVAIIVDSTFDTNNRFSRRDSLYFSLDASGDLYQYGFLKSLIAERETLRIVPQWDRIAAFSQGSGTSWVIARLDTSNGVRTPQTVFGSIETNLAAIAVTINGVQRGVFCYTINVSKPGLRYEFLLLDSPTAIAQQYDRSDVLRNDVLRELRTVRTR